MFQGFNFFLMIKFIFIHNIIFMIINDNIFSEGEGTLIWANGVKYTG